MTQSASASIETAFALFIGGASVAMCILMVALAIAAGIYAIGFSAREAGLKSWRKIA